MESRNSITVQVIKIAIKLIFFIKKNKHTLTTLKFYRAPNDDLRPESLQTCKDNIYLNVFDEVVVDALEVRN